MAHNNTTWLNVAGSWRHGQTKVIRVPIALADRILQYARALDEGKDPTSILVSEFLKTQRRRYHCADIEQMTSGFRWQAFNDFCRWLAISRQRQRK